MPIRIEITGENAGHAWDELKGLAAPAFAVPGYILAAPGRSTSEIHIPNAETAEALEASRAGDVIRAENVDELLSDAATPEPTKRGRRKKAEEPSAVQHVDLKALETPKAAEPAPLISTQPEDRHDPADPVVADEPEAKAEESSAPVEIKPATKDDVRNALMDYAAAYGMPHAQTDGPQLLGVAKVSDVPADKYDEALAKIQAAIKDNPFGRTPVKAGA